MKLVKHITAPLFVFAILLSSSITVQASEGEPTVINIGTLNTDNGRTALNFALKRVLSNQLDSVKTWKNNNKSNLSRSCVPKTEAKGNVPVCKEGEWIKVRRFTNDGSSITPAAEVTGGAEDSFDGVILKLTGHYLMASATKIYGAHADGTPDETVFEMGLNLENPFYVVPFAFGLETTRELDFASGLFEVGLRPYIMQNFPLQIGRDIQFGAFIQTGYKFKIDDNVNASAERDGGAKDESSENTDDFLARLKFDAAFDIDLSKSTIGIAGLGGLPLKFIGHGKFWYDAANNDTYHSLAATLRMTVNEQQKSFIDFTYQKGSGAPTFNQGTQFGAKLTIKY
jgi:hypothetical protein